MAQATNTNAVLSIAAPAGAVGDDCTHISLWATEVGGDFLRSQAISTDPDALALGERYLIAGGVWVQFHTGAPGANGTDNVIDELGRVQIAQAAFTVTQ